jgi:anti-sigma factor RsiW
MTQPSDPALDPIMDCDLDAYVDDQLAPTRRVEVEAFLSRNPKVAARVMADLRARDELRLALADRPRVSGIGAGGAARRLERALVRDRALARFRRVAAIAAFVGAGWFAHAQLGAFSVTDVVASTPPPAFVSDALMSHRTALLRGAMASQPRVRAFDSAEIRSQTAIVLPALPVGWQVHDVQIFPSHSGPSVEIALDAGRSGTLSLFAARPGWFAISPVATTTQGELTAAYWQMGEVAYALVGKGADRAIAQAADGLSKSLH